MGWGYDRICSWYTFTSHETFLPIQLCKEYIRNNFRVFRLLHILRSNESFYTWYRHQQKEFDICSYVTSFHNHRVTSNTVKLCTRITWNRYSPFVLDFFRFNIGVIKDCNIYRHSIQPTFLATMVFLRLLWYVWYFKFSIVCGFFRAQFMRIYITLKIITIIIQLTLIISNTPLLLTSLIPYKFL